MEIHWPDWIVETVLPTGTIPPVAMAGGPPGKPLPALTVKLCVAGVAAPKVALPACVAVIVHVPTASGVTVEPLTVQMFAVVEAKLTGSPELAVAATSNGGAPANTLGKGPKVIVCSKLLLGVSLRTALFSLSAMNTLPDPSTA